MIIKDETFLLPEAIEPSSASLFIYTLGDPEKNPESYAIAVPMTAPAEIYAAQHKAKFLGRPAIFSVKQIGQHELLFYPVPDKEYYARFRYCPAMKEI